ncbi:hypothetical protein [Bifidobacterium longum]|uniref:hypothetical protein n=1 Tax=Bifidobacterium longum TaxID=216816 RepID=UPI0035624143
MTATITDIEDFDVPLMLDTQDVVEAFKRCNLAVYAEARREFYREVNLNPFKPHSKNLLRMVEWAFWDWFAFDCVVSATGLTGDESSDMKIELEHNPTAGISPFLAVAEFLHADEGTVDARGIHDLRDVDDTNFASMFWIKDASAAQGRIRVEDIIHGGIYDLADPQAARQYDGACGGMIVNRIARVRGVWKSCAIPIYEARRPDDPEVGATIAQGFRESGYRPDFPGLVRFFYGRAKDTGLDWEGMVAARDAGTLDRLIQQACD